MGIVDILINNAGLMPKNSFRDGDPSNVRRVMDVNVLAHFWVIGKKINFEILKRKSV